MSKKSSKGMGDREPAPTSKRSSTSWCRPEPRTMNAFVRKATLLLVLFTVIATAAPLIAAGTGGTSRYLVVLKSGPSGVSDVTDAQIATLGGRVEYRLP